MAATKNAITQKAAIAIVRNYVEQYPGEFEDLVCAENPDATVDDLLDVLGNMFCKLNRTRTNTNSKKRDENLALLDLVVPFMGEPHTAGEVKDLVEQIASAPKATAVLKLGVQEGVLVRLKKQKKSESYKYVLAGTVPEDEIEE